MTTLPIQSREWIHTAPFQAAATREIDATPAEVFDALCQHERWPEWFAAIHSVERIGDQHEGVGSKRRVFINSRMPVDEEFIVWEPGEAWGFSVFEVKAPLRAMNELVTIEDLGDGRSRVTYRMGIEAKGWFQPILRLGRRQMEKNLANALEALGPWIAANRPT